jgi:hypothetical protein
MASRSQRLYLPFWAVGMLLAAILALPLLSRTPVLAVGIIRLAAPFTFVLASIYTAVLSSSMTASTKFRVIFFTRRLLDYTAISFLATNYPILSVVLAWIVAVQIARAAGSTRTARGVTWNLLV